MSAGLLPTKTDQFAIKTIGGCNISTVTVTIVLNKLYLYIYIYCIVIKKVSNILKHKTNECATRFSFSSEKICATLRPR